MQQWLRTLLIQFRMWQRLPWQHLVAHCSVVDENCFYGGGLRQISALQPLVGVLVRVVSPGTVVQGILYELETRNTNGIESLVISATGVTQGNRRNAEVLQW